MSLRSLIYPTTNQIPMKGTFRITSDLIKRDWDDAFQDSYNASLWTETLTGTTSTLSTSPLTYQMTAGGDEYQLASDNLMPDGAHEPADFCMEFGLEAEVSTGPVVLGAISILAGATLEVSLSARYIGGSYEAQFSDTITTHTVTDVFGDGLFKLRLYYVEGQFHAFYFDTTDNSWTEIGSAIAATKSADWHHVLSGYNAVADTNVVKLHAFKMLPVLRGAYDRDFGTDVAHSISVQNGEASFLLNAGYPGTFDVELWGAGSSFSSTEAFELEVVDFTRGNNDVKLMNSDVERFYIEGDVVTGCPIHGVPANKNRGSLILNNQCCFCDGSTAHQDPIEVISKSYGKYDQYGDRKRVPSFIVSDENDNEYSTNFEFQRIHAGVPGLDLADDAFRIQNLRQLNLSDGKRIYYGTQVDPIVNQNVIADITYNWSADQLALTGAAIDNFEWELAHEDGTVIDSASGINYTNYTDPSNIPSTETLNRGKYYFMIRSYGEGPSGASLGANAEVSIHQGSLTSDPVIAEGYAEAMDDDGGSVQWQTGTCYINFEIKEFRSQFVVYVFDPCASSLTKYEASTFDISNRSDSIAAFENEDGDVVLLYQDASTDYLYNHRSADLAYRVFDVSAGTFSSPKVVYLPSDVFGDDGYVYAFDAQRVGDEVNFFVSVEKDGNYLEAPEGLEYQHGSTDTVQQWYDRNIPYSPIGEEGIVKITTPISNNSWDATKDSDIRFFTQSTLKVDSFKNVLADSKPTVYWRYDLYDHWAFPSSIRVNYSPSFELDVVSVLDMHTRLPLILLGRSEKYSEAAFPLHFNAYDLLTYDVFETFGIGFKNSLMLDSFDAVLGPDGMLYSFASKGHRVEMGVNDPEVFWSERETVIGRNQAASLQYKNTWYQTTYQNQTFPVVSIGESDDEQTRVLINCHTHQHYMTLLIGENFSSFRPVIYQNGAWDELPYETTSERVWYGELEDNPTYVNSQSAFFAGNDGYCRLQAIGNSTFTYSYLFMQLDDAGTYQHAHLNLTNGVKCHFRLQPQLEAGQTKLQREVQIQAQLIDYLDGTDINALGSPYIVADVRYMFDGEVAKCQYYDWWAGPPAWVTVKTFTGLDPEKVYDFYFLVQRFDEDKYRVAYVIKHQHHTQDAVDGVENNYDFKNELVAYHLENYIRAKDYETTEQGLLYVAAGSDSSAVDLNEYIRVHEMSFNQLKVRQGPFYTTEVTKAASPYTVYQETNFQEDEAEKWRRFNDNEVFTYDGGPTYPFRTGYMNEVGESAKFHWYNGYVFHFTGQSAFIGDEWTLERQYLNQPNTLVTKNGTGIWITNTDQSVVVIYADAEDAGLEKHRANTFVVDGANVRNVKVVGKDNIGDSWTTLGTIDLTQYHLDVNDWDVNDEKVRVQVNGMDVPISKYEQLFHYLIEETNSSRKAVRLIESDSDRLYGDGESAAAYADTKAFTFLSRGLVKLDSIQEYRYLGFQIDPFDTNEGYFRLHNVDFGITRDLPLGVDSGTGYSTEMETNVEFLVSQQPVHLGSERKIGKLYSFSYSLEDADTFMKLTSLFDEINLSGQHLWVMPDMDNNPHELFIGIIDGEATHEVLTDEDGEKYYRITFEVRSVEE